MAEHAFLAPSSAHQWVPCPGSVKAQISAPNLDTAANREGTAAHWVCQSVLERHRAGDATATADEYLGKQSENGVLVDEKIVEGASIYCARVLDVAYRYDAVGRLQIEQRVQATRIHPHSNWGTLDAALFLPEHRALFLWDYKHGYRRVHADGNWQFVNYAAGLIEYHRIDGIDDQNITLHAEVVHPYCYQAPELWSSWSILLCDLRAYINVMQASAHEAMSDQPRLSTGAWCRDCRAVMLCSAARQKSYRLLDYVQSPFRIEQLSGEELAIERDALTSAVQMAESRIEALEQQLKYDISQGDHSSGLTLQSNRGRLAWTVSAQQAVAFLGQFGVDISKDGAMTPTQAINKTPAAIRDAVKQAVKQITTRPSTGLSLTKASESRAARAFK